MPEAKDVRIACDPTTVASTRPSPAAGRPPKLDLGNHRVLFLGLTQAWSAADTPAGLGLEAGD